MANDATSKSTSNSNCTENSSLSNQGDQQKVPPLRIVLNSAGNQKSSTATATSHQQTSNKKDKAPDNKQDSQLKSGGRVRIKLGTNRQQPGKANSETIDALTKLENQKSKDRSADKQLENINEDSASSFNHLRRITRRSQRAVQSFFNEDEESISSMTSIDENLNSTNNSQQISDINLEADQSNTATTAPSTASNNATNGSSSADTPRRHKRKKVDSSDSQSLECDSLLGTQNYRLPNQNSFELFKNIRKQVDKKLKSLVCVQPKIPFGFRDYMLSRGAYLLDGNKLGNGTNLFMNEHGGLNPAPPGKYHLIRQNRVNYSVPNRAKAPLELPTNSPLFELFIEQEKERYRMRIQHIKEREKLTLAAEQEFMRVYNQAALAESNQTETFSVCTMLKHQEMYNYLDSDGLTILSREDAQQEQANQPDGVRTRRRQHGPISPAPARRGQNSEESTLNADNSGKKVESVPAETQDEKKSDKEQSKIAQAEKEEDPKEASADASQNSKQSTASQDIPEDSEKDIPMETQPEDPQSTAPNDTGAPSIKTEKIEISETNNQSSSAEPKALGSTVTETINENEQTEQDDSSQSKNSAKVKESSGDDVGEDTADSSVDSKSVADRQVTDEEKEEINRKKFLTHLQEIDDKWDKIRHEMLIRHKNEAESLHAIQKLEWEWKAKEIGVCDVRTTLLIDNTFVPKLDVFSQDY